MKYGRAKRSSGGVVLYIRNSIAKGIEQIITTV